MLGSFALPIFVIHEREIVWWIKYHNVYTGKRKVALLRVYKSEWKPEFVC